MKILLVVVLFLARACTADAQATNTQVSKEMKALNFLVGKWQGKVIYDPDSNQRQEVPWTAHVYYTVGGNILLIDEKESEMESRSKTKRAVFVVIYWDSAGKAFPTRLHHARESGTVSTEGTGYVQDNKFVVLRNQPNAVNRYTLRLNEKGQWYEVGEVSSDGQKSWKRRFEMTLNRKD